MCRVSRDADAADERTVAVALQKLRQAGVLKTLEQRSDELRCSGGTQGTALEHQIESAHLQLAGIQVCLCTVVDTPFRADFNVQVALQTDFARK